VKRNPQFFEDEDEYEDEEENLEMTAEIHIILPAHLRTLANLTREVTVQITGPVTQRTILDAVEKQFPMLEGTMRDHHTKIRRPLVRFFACEEDVSHDDPDKPLPDAVAAGKEPFYIIGAIAGG